MKPLAVDLCCGLGGWTDGLLAENWDVVGFDIERHVYGDHQYPAQLVLQDILTIDGRQFKGKVSLIVASPPCQRYSYMSMPWSKAKALIAWHRDPAHPERIVELNAIFDACLRIAAEAECPIVIENVRGANPWVGRSRANYGSYHLWGDVPALMPMTQRGRSKFPAPCGPRMWSEREFDGDGHAFHQEGSARDGIGRSMQSESVDRHVKNGGDWFDSAEPSEQRRHGSKSSARKAASAMIARIPFELARHIGAVYFPREKAA